MNRLQLAEENDSKKYSNGSEEQGGVRKTHHMNRSSQTLLRGESGSKRELESECRQTLAELKLQLQAHLRTPETQKHEKKILHNHFPLQKIVIYLFK